MDFLHNADQNMIRKTAGCFALLVFATISMLQMQAQTFSVLYTFTGGSDGFRPYAGLTLDSAGNLYGTTSEGGGSQWCPFGCGTVFEIDTTGKETILHRFHGSDGTNPQYGTLLRDGAGNLYGTTYSGGSFNNGVAFRLDSAGHEIMFSFPGGSKGGFPYGGLIMDSAGSLYGTTFLRGFGAYGFGTVFKLNKTGQETVLHTFRNGEGENPVGGLVRDGSGNLYGTTEYGGVSFCSSPTGLGCGTIFKIDTAGNETVLHEFGMGDDGANPTSDLVMDNAGNLYGTTQFGGAAGYGTVFKVDPSGNETVVYSFVGPPDGYYPWAGLAIDSSGNLYGTTPLGGASFFGTVFEIDATGKETILYNFQGQSDGGQPYSKLVRDNAGNIYGTTSGLGAGTVFKIATQ